MSENEKKTAGRRRKACPFLGRTSSEVTETGTLTRTWFPPCIGASCAAYVPAGDRRAVCARLGVDVTPQESGSDPSQAWRKLREELDREEAANPGRVGVTWGGDSIFLREDDPEEDGAQAL